MTAGTPPGKDVSGTPLTQQKLQMRFVFRRPGAQQWWRDWRETCPLHFRNYVDGLIREGETAE